MGDPHYMVLLNNEPIVDVGRPSQSYPVFPLFVKRNDAVGYMAAMSIPHPDCGLWTGTMEEAVAFCGGGRVPAVPDVPVQPTARRAPYRGHMGQCQVHAGIVQPALYSFAGVCPHALRTQARSWGPPFP